MKQKYKDWTKIDWDGNPDLNLKCWRKSFGKGCVSVGIGDFKYIVYSHGPNSEESMTSTRTRVGGIEQTEEEAMKEVDLHKGYYRTSKSKPDTNPRSSSRFDYFKKY